MKREEEDSTKRPKKKITKEALKKSVRLFKYIRPYSGTFSIGLIFLILSSASSMVFPYLTGKLVDASNIEIGEEINNIALKLLLVFALFAIFSFFRIYLFAIVTQKSLAHLRQDVYHHLIHLPLMFFSSRRVGELNSRISSDISLLQETLMTTIAELLRQIIIIIIGIWLLAFLSVKLTFFMLGIIPVVAIAAVFFGKHIRKLSKITQNTVAESNVIVEETLQGISSVKAFSNEAFEYQRYFKKTQSIINIALHGAKWRASFASFLIFCLFGSIIGVIWYGVLLIQSNELSVGELFTFILYSVFVGASFGGIADHYAQLQKAIGATENLLEIFDEKMEDQHLDSKHTISKGEIAFKEVSFHYENRKDVQVLNQLSFEIPEGKVYALVGPSGGGKTTVTSLLYNFYQPQSGQITIDGVPIEEYPLLELRSAVGIVPQEVLLFGGSILENIQYGKPTASKEEIIQAAVMANASEFIEGFPEKYETLVGERGIQLSGGQKQRIAIARAILKNPKILILDEATSALDSKSESLVQDALKKLMNGRTSLVIAHRLSTIQHADQIMVMDKGQVLEMGTHEELSSKSSGLYQELKNFQT